MSVASNPSGTVRPPLLPRSLLAVALLLLGGKLLLIARFGSSLPGWSEWLVGAGLFPAFLDGTLDWRDLFAAHYEHRLLCTRLLDIVLLQVNGEVWNPLLEMLAGALLHVAALVLLLGMLAPALPAARQAALLLVASLILLLPADGANTVDGFQSQVYFALLFGLLFFRGIGLPPFSAGWWLGALTGGLACLSCASGVSAVVTGAGVTALRLGLSGTRGWRPWLAATLLLTGALLAVVMTPHQVSLMLTVQDGATAVINTRASGVVPFLKAFYAALSWPTLLLAPLVQWPLARLLWNLWRRPQDGSGTAWFAATTGLWTLLLAALLAWGRSSNPVMSRYATYYLVGLVINLWCLLATLPSGNRRQHLLAAGWVVIILGSLAVSVGRDLLLATNAPLNASVAAADIRDYLASGNAAALRPRNIADRLYDPHPDVMRVMLDAPAVRHILPPALLPAHAAREPAPLRWLLGNLQTLGLLLVTAGCALALWQWLAAPTRQRPRPAIDA